MIKDTLPNGRIIYQLPEQNNYTQDSVLLANFIDINKKCERILDLCCGNGVVSLLLDTNVNIVGVDIQKNNIDLFNKSVSDNNLTHIYPLELDINNILDKLEPNSWDLIICNPPYFICETESRLHHKQAMQIARHEVLIDFATIVNKVKSLLSNKGKFVFIHITQRLDEIIKTLYYYEFSISKMQFIYTSNKEASRVIIECVKRRKVHTKILAPIVIK